MDWSADAIERRLIDYRAQDPSPLLTPRRAAVAALLRFDRRAPEVLLMRRAVHETDRWSGHVSLPGGREEPGDADLVATAVRETREEVGIDLARAGRLVGRIDGVRAVAKGQLLPMSITPYVFEQVQPVEPVLGPEATETFWLPLDRAANGELDGVFAYRSGPLSLDLPCWRYEDRVVWGLTYQMLRDLIRVVRE